MTEPLSMPAMLINRIVSYSTALSVGNAFIGAWMQLFVFRCCARCTFKNRRRSRYFHVRGDRVELDRSDCLQFLQVQPAQHLNTNSCIQSKHSPSDLSTDEFRRRSVKIPLNGATIKASLSLPEHNVKYPK